MRRSSHSRYFALSLLGLCLGGWLATPIQAQGMLRESLELLDRDDNGELEPDEITPLARPYLERIARGKRLSLNRANSIEDFQESARVYYAQQNGVTGERVRAEPQLSIRSFRPRDEEELVPAFGLPEVKYPYTQDDLEEADRTLRRSDRNDDGYIDRRESYRAEWTHRNPFDDDLNHDDRLSRMELAQRYARRRLLSGDAQELIQKARRTGNGIRAFESSGNREKDERRGSDWWRRGGSNFWLTASILGRFDENRNGRLEAAEAKSLNLPVSLIDIDRDGELTRDELQEYMSSLQEEAGGSAADGLPGWFFELDADRDGQVAMAEFTTEWTESKLNQFASLDLNEDGFLTEMEVASSKAMMGGAFSNDNAEVIPPFKTIISEIEITDEFTVQDLDLRLSITHSNVGFLDGYLTGPDGQRIELFTEVGGGGDHFEETVFDDQAQTPIVKARPPFEGRYLPEGLVKRQPGLGAFRGKPAQGVWQLVIRATRSDRFGMLHGWSLIFKVEEAMLDSTPVTGSDSEPAQPEQRKAVSRPEPQRSDAEVAKENARQQWSDFAVAAKGSGELPEDPERRERIERMREMIDEMRDENGQISPENWGRIKSAWQGGGDSKGESKRDSKGERKRR